LDQLLLKQLLITAPRLQKISQRHRATIAYQLGQSQLTAGSL
jgi:hypothetical protein